MTLSSTELARHHAANPHNLPGVPGFPALAPIDACAARFEAEGRAAYPHGRNPYAAGTMANTRWAAGWQQSDNAACVEAR